MELVAVAAAVIFFFMWRASRRNARQANDHITSQAISDDLDRAGFVEGSVRYFVYRGRPYALTGGAVIVGYGRVASGEEVGFLGEVHDQYGSVGFELIRPHGIATWHKQASLRSLETGLPLTTVLKRAAEEHGKQYPRELPATTLPTNDAAEARTISTAEWAKIAGNISGALWTAARSRPEVFAEAEVRVVVLESLSVGLLTSECDAESVYGPRGIAFAFLRTSDNQEAYMKWVNAMRSSGEALQVVATDNFAKALIPSLRASLRTI